MPKKLRLTVRKGSNISKPKAHKSPKYRAGMPSPLFESFRKRADLDERLRELLDKHKVTDDKSSEKKALMELTLKNLPTIIPSRNLPAPIPGQRDHFYVKFYVDMMTYIDIFSSDNKDHDGLREYRNLDIPVFYRPNYTRNRGIIGNLVYNRGVLHYFDDGAGHPHAKKPAISKKDRLHLKKMLAKRERTG